MKRGIGSAFTSRAPLALRVTADVEALIGSAGMAEECVPELGRAESSREQREVAPVARIESHRDEPGVAKSCER